MPVIMGTILDDTGAPASRRIRIYNRTTGIICGEIDSDATTGDYAFHLPTTDEVQRIVLSGTVYDGMLPDLIDRIVPGYLPSGIAPWQASSPDGIVTTLAVSVDETEPVFSVLADSVSTVAGKWRNAVLAADGNVYAVPTRGDYGLLKIDTSTDIPSTVELFSTSADEWFGAALGGNGKIYGTPCTGGSILEYDVASGSATTFASLAHGLDHAWYDAVRGPDGCIYCAAGDYPSILKINPFTQELSYIGSLGEELDKYKAINVGPDGNLYCLPYAATSILEVDPFSGLTDNHGEFTGGGFKWSKGVLAPNGKIYGIPQDASDVLVFDPVTKSSSLLPTSSATSKWAGGCLGSNGKVYAFPFGDTSGFYELLEIDPATDTVKTFGFYYDPNGGDYAFSDAVLAQNKALYAIPYSASRIAKIVFAPQNLEQIGLDVVLNLCV